MKKLMTTLGAQMTSSRRWLTVGLGALIVCLASVALAQSTGKPDPFGGSVEYRTLFDPTGPMGWLNPRVIVWILAQLHLLFAAFVLAVPMFVVIIEVAGHMSKDAEQAKKYDDLAHEFCKLLTTAFSITSILGALFTFVCIGLYPKVFAYLAHVFGPTMYLYAFIFFGESFSLYLYYYGWGKFSKWGHILLGLLLNVFGVTLMLVANAWTTFAMAPGGLADDGSVVDRSAAFWNFLLHPINIHRLIANLCLGGSVAGAYAAYKWLTTNDPAKKAHYDWMGYIGNFIAILALLPLPFAGYYLGFEIYQYNQQLGIYMMGGVLSWLFVMQAVLVGALFFAANYYLWLGMDRIEGAERFRGWIKFLLGIITLGILVWATPKSIGSIASSAEIDAMGGPNHPIFSIFGVMSAKNTAVNLIILATFLSFLLYRRGNKVPTVSWAPIGTVIQALAFGAAAGVVIVIGVGGYIPGWWMESSIRIRMSPWQVVAVLTCIAIVMPLDILMLRNAKIIGKIKWGQVSRRAQYTLLFLAVSFTWLMALMGFVRSSLRQNWHVYEVMKDTSPWAYTPSIGYATVVVTAVVMLFFLLVSVVVWISNLGALPAHADRPAVPFRTRLAQAGGVLFMVALLLYGGGKLFGGHKKEAPPVQLTELQERDDKMLNTYGAVDVERGVYQVPVNQAFAMLTGNPSLLEPSVLPPADLDEMSPTERGEWLFHKSTEFACGGCHKVDGTQGSAPSLRDKFGQETKLDGADPVQFDDAYFLESLEKPEAKFADGFAKSTTKMPSFKGKISKQQLEDFKAYLKSL